MLANVETEIVTDCMQAGAFFGVLFVSWIMDRYGRKAGMIYCAFWSLLGGALLCGSNGVAMFITARFFVRREEASVSLFDS